MAPGMTAGVAIAALLVGNSVNAGAIDVLAWPSWTRAWATTESRPAASGPRSTPSRRRCTSANRTDSPTRIVAVTSVRPIDDARTANPMTPKPTWAVRPPIE